MATSPYIISAKVDQIIAPSNIPTEMEEETGRTREFFNSIGKIYRASPEKEAQEFAVYAKFLKDHPEFSRYITFFFQGYNPDYIEEIVLQLYLFSERFDCNIVPLFFRDVGRIGLGHNTLRSLFPHSFASYLYDNSEDYPKNEDFLILLEKVSQLVKSEPLPKDLEKSYLTPEESKRLCDHFKERMGNAANTFLLTHRLWDNCSNFTGENLKHYRMGLYIIGTTSFEIQRKQKNISEGFAQLNPKDQDRLALLLGKREALKSARKAAPTGNGLIVIENHKSSDDQEIDKLVQMANATPRKQSSATPVPSPRPNAPSAMPVNLTPAPQLSPRAMFAPSPSGPGSSAMHAALALIPSPTHAPSHQPAYRGASAEPRYFQPSPATKLPDSGAILKGFEQQKEEERVKIIAQLTEYKAEIDADLRNGKEYDFSFFGMVSIGISKKWKQAVVEKILRHLNTEYSIEDLELDLHDREALEDKDSELNKIALQIHGYNIAIQNVKTPISRK